MDKKELKFLKESNAIEREYSEIALNDSIKAWEYAKNFIPSGRKIDIPMILTVHQFLMSRLDSRIAGKIRECDVWVGNRKCLAPEEIRLSLQDWCLPETCPDDANEETIEADHVWFEKIHPFEDGNGRTGRILMNIQRLKLGLPILIIHEGKEQQEYYKWFREIK